MKEIKKSENLPKFSILMANYNNGKYIEEAIDSVLNQTFQDWELIIVDDCSTDDSLEKIKPYLKDTRVRLLKNDVNLGKIDTLKKMVYESKAEIFGELDSDDALYSDAIEIMYNAHQEHSDCGLIYSQFVYCDPELNPKKKGYCCALPTNKTSLHCDCVSAFRTFKKTDYFKTEGWVGEELYAAEDKDIILKMEEVTKLFYVDKILYKYRFLPYSLSRNPLKKRIGQIDYILVKYNAYKRRLNSSIPNITRTEMCSELFNGIYLSIRVKDYRRARYFFKEVIKLDPRIILNFSTFIINNSKNKLQNIGEIHIFKDMENDFFKSLDDWDIN